MYTYKLIKSKIKSKLVYSKVVKKSKFLNGSKFNRVKDELALLKNPYGLNFRNYFIIKYILSLVFFVIIIFRTKSIIISSIYFLIIFFIPDILIRNFKKNQSNKLINEIRNLCNNLILLLTSNVSFYEALKISANSLEDKLFKEKFIIFVEDYSLFNFKLGPALEKFKNNFTSEELNMFLGIIYEGDREGKMIEMLEVFYETLELSYFKYTKYKKMKVSSYILIASIISLIDISTITVYPMMVQIVQNLGVIFR